MFYELMVRHVLEPVKDKECAWVVIFSSVVHISNCGLYSFSQTRPHQSLLSYRYAASFSRPAPSA